MKKYKICVYAISKNESQFINRWYESVSEADAIYVLDTGSTDNTVSLLKGKGIIVKEQIIKPWRFDVARNISLEMIPSEADICVCTDLDEVFEKGWRKKLEDSYKKGHRVNYTYNWHINDKGIPDVSFALNKIHPRNNYKWIHPVHEILMCTTEEKQLNIMDIIVNHYPDTKKSRSNYLNLLELSIKEDPLDDRNMHYLGREYMYYGYWNKCIKTLKQHLKLETSKWNLERAASMRFIARSYIQLNNYKEAEKWYKRAIEEANYIREAYVELAMLYNKEQRYLESILYLTKALCIKKKELIYINEVFSWDTTIDDLLSINYYNLKLYDISLFYSQRALKVDPKNERLLNNKEIINSKLHNSST